MKRDMDLCRDILIEMEESDSLEQQGCDNLHNKEYTFEEIKYHCHLLNEHGLIRECTIGTALGVVTVFHVSGLTWDGHDFLEKVRNDTLWSKTKAHIKEKALPFTIDIIKQVIPLLLSLT